MHSASSRECSTMSTRSAARALFVPNVSSVLDFIKLPLLSRCCLARTLPRQVFSSHVRHRVAIFRVSRRNQWRGAQLSFHLVQEFRERDGFFGRPETGAHP